LAFPKSAREGFTGKSGRKDVAVLEDVVDPIAPGCGGHEVDDDDPALGLHGLGESAGSADLAGVGSIVVTHA
jgi:hypothetical protein